MKLVLIALNLRSPQVILLMNLQASFCFGPAHVMYALGLCNRILSSLLLFVCLLRVLKVSWDNQRSHDQSFTSARFSRILIDSIEINVS